MVEIPGLEGRRVRTRLGEHHLEFVAGTKDPVRATFRAYADPVDAGGRDMVPLVSIAISTDRSLNAVTRGSSNCSSGSPPVQTTKG